MKCALAAIDLDGTLLDYEYEEGRACSKLCQQMSCMFEVTPEEAFTSYRRAKEIERSTGDARAAVLGRFDALVELHAWPQASAAILCRMYVEHRLNNCRILPGARALMRALADYAERVVVITNGMESLQRDRLARVGLSRYVDWLFVSSAVGCRKPDRRFFDKVAKVTGVSVADWLVFGDDFATDLALPATYGATTILIDSANNPNHCARHLRAGLRL